MFPCIFKRYKIANFVNENSISKGAFIVYYLSLIHISEPTRPY